MRLLLAAALALIATPSLAQFPPPGIYLCVDKAEMPYGTINLLVAGDYTFTAENGIEGKGQIASAGNTIDALSGPLKDINLKGSFSLDEFGEAKFELSSDIGPLTCGLPPE